MYRVVTHFKSIQCQNLPELRRFISHLAGSTPIQITDLLTHLIVDRCLSHQNKYSISVRTTTDTWLVLTVAGTVRLFFV